MASTRVLSDSTRKHLTVVELQTKQAEEQAIQHDRDQVNPDNPPEELRDAVARKEWKRILPVLESIELLGNCDRVNLIGYCNAWSKYVAAIREDDDSKILKFGEEVRKFERGCYLTPDSRLKAATVKRKKKEKQMEAKFGVI